MQNLSLGLTLAIEIGDPAASPDQHVFRVDGTQRVSSVMKNKHDTAKASIQNVR